MNQCIEIGVDLDEAEKILKVMRQNTAAQGCLSFSFERIGKILKLTDLKVTDVITTGARQTEQ